MALLICIRFYVLSLSASSKRLCHQPHYFRLNNVICVVTDDCFTPISLLISLHMGSIIYSGCYFHAGCKYHAVGKKLNKQQPIIILSDWGRFLWPLIISPVALWDFFFWNIKLLQINRIINTLLPLALQTHQPILVLVNNSSHFHLPQMQLRQQWLTSSLSASLRQTRCKLWKPQAESVLELSHSKICLEPTMLQEVKLLTSCSSCCYRFVYVASSGCMLSSTLNK